MLVATPRALKERCPSDYAHMQSAISLSSLPSNRIGELATTRSDVRGRLTTALAMATLSAQIVTG